MGAYAGLCLLADRVPPRVWATSRPKTAQDRPQRAQGSPRTAYRGPRGSPGPPTEALRVAQGRQQRPQGPPMTAHRGSKGRPGLCLQGAQGQPRTTHRGPKGRTGPPTRAPGTAEGRPHRPGPTSSRLIINRKFRRKISKEKGGDRQPWVRLLNDCTA